MYVHVRHQNAWENHNVLPNASLENEETFKHFGTSVRHQNYIYNGVKGIKYLSHASEPKD